MAWVTNITIDPDKTNVGSVTAVFTDTDGSTFSASARGTITQANATAFVNAAIAGRNSWQTRKTSEGNDRTVLNNTFAAAVPTESASSSAINNTSITINLAG